MHQALFHKGLGKHLAVSRQATAKPEQATSSAVQLDESFQERLRLLRASLAQPGHAQSRQRAAADQTAALHASFSLSDCKPKSENVGHTLSPHSQISNLLELKHLIEMKESKQLRQGPVPLAAKLTGDNAPLNLVIPKQQPILGSLRRSDEMDEEPLNERRLAEESPGLHVPKRIILSTSQ